MSDRPTGMGYNARWDVRFRLADAILAHPDFSRARSTYIQAILGLYGGDAFLNRLLMVAARIVIFAVAICLDASYRPSDRATWPTIGNLKKALAGFGITSPRRIDQVVARLVQIGFLTSTPSDIDGRVRLLQPTPQMLAHDQDWLLAHYQPLALLFGEEDYGLPLGRDPDFQRTQRALATDFFAESAAVLLSNPGIMLFLSREAGILVLLQLAKASIDSESATVPLSISDLGRRFAISRTHVRQLLLDAQAQGLIDLDPAVGSATLRPALFECLDRFIAEGMSNHDLTGAAARRRCTAACAGE